MTVKERMDFSYAEYLYYFDPTPQYLYDNWGSPREYEEFVDGIYPDEIEYD